MGVSVYQFLKTTNHFPSLMTFLLALMWDGHEIEGEWWQGG
jgi:hypothetical protein